MNKILRNAHGITSSTSLFCLSWNLFNKNKNSFLNSFLGIIFFSIPSLLYADQSFQDDPEALLAIEAYEERSWELGLAAGYGVKTNPLVNSDDIPMYVVLNIAWFGDYLFFDNGDLGLTVHETDQFSFNLITHLNNEREIFEWLNSAQLGLHFSAISSDFSPPAVSNVANTTTDGFTDFELDSAGQVIEIPKRSLAVDGGIEIIYSGDWGDIQLQMLSDLSFTHEGFEVWASYAFPWRHGDLTLVPSVGLNWKSRDLLDYYYGVRSGEAVINRPAYQARSGVNSFAKFAISYRIDDNWGIVGVAEYEGLSRSIRQSPIVDQDSIKTIFIGLMYNF